MDMFEAMSLLDMKSDSIEFDKLNTTQKVQTVKVNSNFKELLPLGLNIPNFQKSDITLLNNYKQKITKLTGGYLDDVKKDELENLIYKQVSVYKKYSGLNLYEIYNEIGYHSELGLTETDYIEKFIIDSYYGRIRKTKYVKNYSGKEQRFEKYIRFLDKYLGKNGCTCKEKILETFIKRKPGNKLIEAVFDNSFTQNYKCKFPRLNRLGVDTDNVETVIKSLQECNFCSLGQQCNAKSHLMFWLIFTAGMDDENFNENIRVISDISFLMSFDEAHLKDWIIAAKGALEGKKLKDLSYSTVDGSDFFIREKSF